MDNFKPNSHKFRNEQNKTTDVKKIEKVVRGHVKTKKKSGVHKLADVFLSEDAPNVKSYILGDVFIPAVKKLFYDIITGGADMLFLGGKGRKSSPASTVNYRQYYDRDRDRACVNNNRTRTGYTYDDIIFDNRGDAEEVLSKMDEVIDMYKIISVNDLYDLAGVSGGSSTDCKYGWTDIRGARVERMLGGGYVIKLPRALPLDV